jgi:hypothetical protein
LQANHVAYSQPVVGGQAVLIAEKGRYKDGTAELFEKFGSYFDTQSMLKTMTALVLYELKSISNFELLVLSPAAVASDLKRLREAVAFVARGEPRLVPGSVLYRKQLWRVHCYYSSHE